MSRSAILVLTAVALTVVPGCTTAEPPDLVVYSALDGEFSEPVLDEFAAKTGLVVAPKFDVESTKTVGLAQAILAERDRPRCDVFWNNEILHTLRLEQDGLLEAYRSPQAERYPEAFRSPDGYWHGFAARARVLIVNTDLVPAAERPRSIQDLASEKWRGHCGIAKPLFGTTATHAACLFAAWGDERAKEYFQRLKYNGVQVLSGNKQVAVSVAAGRLAFGLTDTDDAIVAVEAGHPVAIVYPDRESGELGTLFIPNTLAIIKNCPHPAEARRLVDFLLRAETEAELGAGRSAQIPLGTDVGVEPRVATPRSVQAMAVDFYAAADRWDEAREFLEKWIEE